MLRAFIFDMDGTLVDSIPAHIYAAIEAGRLCGFNFTSEDYLREVGKSFEDIVLSISKKKGISISYDCVKKMRLLKDKLFTTKYVNEVKLLPGALDILKLLKSHGYKLALASASSSKEVNAILDKFELHKFFDVVISKDMVSKAKPDPEIFLKAVSLLNEKPSNAAVFEDSDYGIIAAKKGGFIAYGVLTGKCSKEQLERAGADRIFNDLVEATKYIKSNLSL